MIRSILRYLGLLTIVLGFASILLGFTRFIDISPALAFVVITPTGIFLVLLSKVTITGPKRHISPVVVFLTIVGTLLMLGGLVSYSRLSGRAQFQGEGGLGLIAICALPFLAGLGLLAIAAIVWAFSEKHES